VFSGDKLGIILHTLALMEFKSTQVQCRVRAACKKSNSV